MVAVLDIAFLLWCNRQTKPPKHAVSATIDKIQDTLLGRAHKTIAV